MDAPDPFRLRVLKALCETIKTVTPANGNRNDLSDYTDQSGTLRPRVFRGRDRFGSSDRLPLVTVLEHPRPLEQISSPVGNADTTGEWELVIQGFCEDDPENPTDPAHVLAAEVVQVLGNARKAGRRGNLLGLGSRQPCVMDLRVGPPVVRPADDVISSTAFFYLTVTLQLAEDLSAPFAT